MLTLALLVPFLVVTGAQGVGSVTGWYSLDRLMGAPKAPWVYLLSACSLGVLLAVAIILVTRLRLAITRSPGSWLFAVSLPLTALESVVLGAAAGVLALFAVHLVADAIACARGVLSAC